MLRSIFCKKDLYKMSGYRYKLKDLFHTQVSAYKIISACMHMSKRHTTLLSVT